MLRLVSSLCLIVLLGGPAQAQLTASSSEARAAFRQGNVYERRGDTENANIQYGIACEGGDMRGCMSLAHNFRTGNRIPQDFDQAVNYYALACQGDLAEGCSALGYMANKGLGLEQSYPQSLEFYERGCDLGDQSGCAGAGNLLLTGTGVDQDRRRGGNLLRQACLNRYEWACERLKELGQPLNIGG